MRSLEMTIDRCKTVNGHVAGHLQARVLAEAARFLEDPTGYAPGYTDTLRWRLEEARRDSASSHIRELIDNAFHYILETENA